MRVDLLLHQSGIEPAFAEREQHWWARRDTEKRGARQHTFFQLTVPVEVHDQGIQPAHHAQFVIRRVVVLLYFHGHERYVVLADQ